MLAVLIAPCLAAGSQTDVQRHQAPGPWREQEICLCLSFCHTTQLWHYLPFGLIRTDGGQIKQTALIQIKMVDMMSNFTNQQIDEIQNTKWQYFNFWKLLFRILSSNLRYCSCKCRTASGKWKKINTWLLPHIVSNQETALSLIVSPETFLK